jgi:ABC-type iron transport system FetAB permease component
MVLLTVVFITVFFWGMRKTVSRLQNSSEFSPSEVAAVYHQMLALFVEVPLTFLFIVLAPLIWKQPSPYIFLIGMIIGFAPLAYIAVSSIRNRVAIGGRIPTRGARAVWSGVMNRAFLILVFVGFTIYLASLM